MAATRKVEVLEFSRVSLPPGSVGEASLPLTFFDVVWLEIPPVQRIFFYEFSDSNTTTTSHLLQSLIPNLKHSLSLALQLFYPLAGNLKLSPESNEHEIHYVDGDSVSLTIVESAADFHRLIANHPKDASEFHALAPHLPTSSDLLSLQVTVFPNSGICIGICLHHAAADGRSLNHFVKSWASINRTGEVSSIKSLPFYNRAVIKDPRGLKRLFMNQMEEIKFGQSVEQMDVQTLINPVRATFVLTRGDIERLRQQVMARYNETPKPFRLSTFALACGYVWVCLIKARGDVGDKIVYFLFAVDCRTRLDPPIPDTYFGNGIAATCATAVASDLARQDGLSIASEAIGRAIQGLGDGVLKGAESWIPYIASLANERIVTVAGSPRFQVYDTDFGWGRPKKTEVISIDRTGAIYIGESRDEVDGMEVGLAIPKCELNVFASLFEEGLKSE